MTTEETVNNIMNQTPEMQQITLAFIKALNLKDYSTMKRLTYCRGIIGKGEKWHIKFLMQFGYRQALKQMEKVDYLYWERKALKELLH